MEFKRKYLSADGLIGIVRRCFDKEKLPVEKKCFFIKAYACVRQWAPA